METLVDQFYSHSLEFAKKYLELEEPRADYRGFLELSAFTIAKILNCEGNNGDDKILQIQKPMKYLK